MQEPIGVSGVQAVPNSLHSVRLLDPAEDCAALAGGIVRGRDRHDREHPLGVEARISRPKPQRAVGHGAEAAPLEGVAQLENPRDPILRLQIAVGGDRANILVLDLRPGPH